MSDLSTIIKKELKELLTPATILPILIVALIFGQMGNAFGGIEEEITAKPEIAIINEAEDNYSDIATNILYKNAKVIYNSTNISDKGKAIEKIKREEGLALLIIPENFSARIKNQKPGEIEIYWMIKGGGILDTVSSASVERSLSKISTSISRQMIEKNTTTNASIALQPTTKIETTNFKGKEFIGMSPGQITSILSSQSTFIPIIMMMIIIIAGGMVISSMALEKENKTLETLLTLPIKRSSIVTGKITASAIIGLILALVYMVGIGNYMGSFTQIQVPSSSNLEITLSNFELFLVGISLFVTLVAALSLCMLLGTLADNYKSAQSLTFPITILALFPMLLTMFTDFDTMPIFLKAVIFAIPFSHPMMAPRALLFDNYFLVFSGIAYVALFSLLMIAIVVRVFKSDKLITGSTKLKKLKNLKKKFRVKKKS
ncbi:MAG: ABC transporter permease [Candidatus Thermoplasmatota archaeon]